jgi:hypothetical protein
MLKIVYTETGLHLELLTVDLDEWIAGRRNFAKSIGELMLVSKERATFMLPNQICDLRVVKDYLRKLGVRTITINQCDRDWVEIGLAGSWICTDIDSAEGIFVTTQLDRVESYLFQLWQAAKTELVAYE